MNRGGAEANESVVTAPEHLVEMTEPRRRAGRTSNSEVDGGRGSAAQQNPDPVPDQHPQGFVFIVEDDASLGAALADLLRSFGYRALHLLSPAEFISCDKPDVESCLLLDVQFPDVSGLDLQSGLPAASIHMPVILMTGWADVASSVRGMKAGAVDFLIKPVAEEELLSSVRLALERDKVRREAKSRRDEASARYASLTLRERTVMELVTQGLMNKQVAGLLNLSLIMVKVHRGAVMKKMGLTRFADLVRVAELLKDLSQ